MKRLLLMACLLGSAHAQFSTPPTSITLKESAPAPLEVARQLQIQPAKLEIRLAPGNSAGTLSFAVLSSVNAEIEVRSSDPRLVLRGDGGRIRLTAHTLQAVSLLASAPHSGVLTFVNTEGQTIASAPYMVAAPKLVNQSLSLNYSPASQRASVNYGLSGVPQSPLDLRWNLTVNASLDGQTGRVTGGVGLNLSW